MNFKFYIQILIKIDNVYDYVLIYYKMYTNAECPLNLKLAILINYWHPINLHSIMVLFNNSTICCLLT